MREGKQEMEIKVKELLEYYQKNKSAVALCERKGIAMPPSVAAFVNMCECITVLEPTLQAVIVALFENKWSIRKTAESLHFCTRTVIRKRDTAISEIADLMMVAD